jgi:hypothetical protein
LRCVAQCLGGLFFQTAIIGKAKMNAMDALKLNEMNGFTELDESEESSVQG